MFAAATSCVLALLAVTSSATQQIPVYQGVNVDFVGSWTLFYANTTINNVTDEEPYGPNPQGLLIYTPAPGYTWSEEINARNYTANSTYPAPQSNVGNYQVSDNGTYLGRCTLASTVATNIGICEPAAELNLIKIQYDGGEALYQHFVPYDGVVIDVIWKKFVPGSTSI